MAVYMDRGAKAVHSDNVRQKNSKYLSVIDAAI